MSPESELLITLCRTPLSAAAHDRVIAALAGSPDWENLFHLAEQWEVEAVAFSNLRLRFSEAIPPSTKRRFHRATKASVTPWVVAIAS